MSHTPGPWKWLPDEGQFIVDSKGNILAEVPCQGANAEDGRLIAAAPDLLEALEAIVARDSEHFDAIGKTHYGPFAEIALAAIKKARGE